ncbi:MAG: ornithine carbamoyltransferase [bacterium]|nr:ornithine carbamoyltransferase [bacterium]
MKKDLLCVSDLEPASIWRIFKLSDDESSDQKPLQNKNILLFFEKPSLRTKVSFEVAINQLGGSCLSLADLEIGLGVREEIRDVARVLSSYVDCIIARVFSHQRLIELAQYSTIPVINGLSDEAHPCQALSDLYTIWKKKGELMDLSLSFIGDGSNNVASSLILACSMMGVNITIASPSEYCPRKDVLAKATRLSEASGVLIKVTDNPEEAARLADVLYTDVWTSMGQEREKEERIKAFSNFQINERLLSLAKKDCLVMHCLPAHRKEEITDSCLESPNSIVFEQAKNRLVVQRGILVYLLT